MLHALLLLVFLLGSVASAHARSTVSLSQNPKAAALTAEGAAALKRQDLPAAARALTAAYRLHAAPETLYYLGMLARAENRLLEAHDLLRRYVAEGPDDPDAEPLKEAQRVLGEPLPPHGEVRVLGDKKSFVFVDEQLVGVLPLPLPLLLAAGEHAVVLQLGTQRLEARVSVPEGRTVELRCKLNPGVVVSTLVPALLGPGAEEEKERPEVAPQPLGSAVPPAATAPPRLETAGRPRWRTALGASAVALGVAVLGVGIWGLAIADTCADPGGEIDPAACRGYFRTTAIGGGLVGTGAALAIGGTLLLVLPTAK